MKTTKRTVDVWDIAESHDEDDRQGEHRRIVEVVSRPFDEDGESWVKCRLMPGISCCPPVDRRVADLRPLDEPTIFVHLARVEGHCPFPIDMLRYDCCQTEGDVNARLDADGILLAQVSASRYPCWSDRWHSFAWGVTPLQTLKVR